MPQSLFNIIPERSFEVFTLKECEELVNMLKLKDEESFEFGDMPEFEDDVDIIYFETCTETLTRVQMKQAHERLATMTDTFMNPSLPLIGTNVVAHYIDTGSTRPIRIPP